MHNLRFAIEPSCPWQMAGVSASTVCPLVCFSAMLIITLLPYALMQSPHTIDRNVRGKHVWGTEHGGPQGSNSNGRAVLALPGTRLLSDALAAPPSKRFAS